MDREWAASTGRLVPGEAGVHHEDPEETMGEGPFEFPDGLRGHPGASPGPGTARGNLGPPRGAAPAPSWCAGGRIRAGCQQLLSRGRFSNLPAAMKKPLAVLLHEKLMPGSQLASKLEELDYRVLTLLDPADLAETVRREQAMVVLADLSNRRGDVLRAVASLQRDTATAHVPVIAYAAHEDEKQRESALQAGVRVMATDATILPHLPQFLEHALRLD